MFKHNICVDQPGILDGMPNPADPLTLEFFVNPRCPPALVATEAKAVKVHLGEAAKDLVEDVVVEE